MPYVALFFCLCTFIRLHIKNVLNRLIFVLFFYFQNMITNIKCLHLFLHFLTSKMRCRY